MMDEEDDKMEDLAGLDKSKLSKGQLKKLKEK